MTLRFLPITCLAASLLAAMRCCGKVACGRCLERVRDFEYKCFWCRCHVPQRQLRAILADEAEWLIHNDNVTFVSCPPDYTLGRYDERGFLSVPSPAPAEVE